MINSSKASVLVCTLCLSVFSNIAFASDLYIAEISTESLNVRDKPSTSGNIISALKRGERIVAMPTHGLWLTVLVDGKEAGYVSAKYLKIIRVVSSSDSSSIYGDQLGKKCTSGSADLDLKIVGTDLNCKQGYLSEGYDSCNALFEVSISSDCNERIEAKVDCEAEFKYETTKGITPTRATESGSRRITLRNGKGSRLIEVYWRPGVYFDNVIKVRLNDGSCSITSVLVYE